MLLGRREHYQRALLLRPIAYFPVWETAGAVAYDIAGSQRNGAHVAVTLAQAGIGDGRTCPLYGATSYTNIYSASLNAAFTGAECTVGIWSCVSAAGVWTDGAFHTSMHLYVDANNYIILRKSNVNNQYNLDRVGGGVTSPVANVAATTTDWFHVAITISESAGVNGEVKAYWNGAQIGATQVALGAWAGNLSNSRCVIGAHTTTPSFSWSGRLAHGRIFNYALSAVQIEALYRARF